MHTGVRIDLPLRRGLHHRGHCLHTHTHTHTHAHTHTHTQVRIDYPDAGGYTIEVIAFSLFTEARPQPYALVVSH